MQIKYFPIATIDLDDFISKLEDKIERPGASINR